MAVLGAIRFQELRSGGKLRNEFYGEIRLEDDEWMNAKAPNHRRHWFAVLCLSACCLPPAASLAADRIILRNLALITDRTVKSVDEDGARLDGPLANGRELLPWDEIERGQVNPELQPRFDALQAEFGLPLFRLRQRLKNGDYESLGEYAERLDPQFSSRSSQSALLVCQALARARIVAGRREEAVRPYLRCLELLRSGAAKAELLPGSHALLAEPGDGFCHALPPLWFNSQAAKDAMPSVQETIRRMAQPRPDQAYIYFVSLALAAGDFPAARKVLDAIQGQEPVAAEMRAILLAESEVLQGAPAGAMDALRTRLPDLSAEHKPLALYWLGMAQLLATDEAVVRDGLLDLLVAPAMYAEHDSEIAAAALYQAAATFDKLKQAAAGDRLRRELRTRFPLAKFAGGVAEKRE